MTESKTNERPLKIAVGSDNYKKMATEYDVFVDKTLFIKEIIDSSEEAILITHPRRWGKTLNLDMLKTFLEPESKECEEKLAWETAKWYKPWDYDWTLTKPEGQCNKEIFTGGKFTNLLGEERELKPLEISSVDSGRYMEYQGKYPVIYINLKKVVGDTHKSITIGLRDAVRDTFKKHEYLYEYLEEKSKISSLYLDDLERYKNFKENKYKVDSEEADKQLKGSMKFLSELLYQYHSQKVYILVDEYDYTVNSLLVGYLGKEKTPEKDQLIQSTAKFISDVICVSKDNTSLEKMIFTGILDTAYKEFGSGCNNIKVYGISDVRFSKRFGFSEEEVESIARQFKFKNPEIILDNIKDWYNGYTIPIVATNTNSNSLSYEYVSAYTPWAVMNYVNDVYMDGENTLPRNYWTESGASTLLERLFNKEACIKSTLSEKVLSMAKSSSVALNFNKAKTSLIKYDWFADTDKEEFFSYLLLNAGYFTMQEVNGKYEFSIPNAELLDEFAEVISRNSGECQTILYNLKKTGHLRVIAMIKEKDAEGVKKELLESHIECEDKTMNFNFFHIASIYGDKETFKVLLESDCKEQLDFANDRVGGLKAIDYAYMLKNEGVMEVITSHYEDKNLKSVEIPGWGNSILCYGYYNSITAGGVSGSFDLLKDIVLESFGVKLAAKLGINVVASITNMFGSSSIEQQCNEYAEYQSIDISNPGEFKSLKQYEKYLLVHENAEVIVNGKCGEGLEEISSIKFDVFKNSFYSDEELEFILCDGELKKENVGEGKYIDMGEESAENNEVDSEQAISKSYEVDNGEAIWESIPPRDEL